MANLILIDSRVSGVNDIVSSLTPNTDYLVFDFGVDTFESLQSRIQKPYSSVAIAQHNYGLPMFQMISLSWSGILKDVSKLDSELKSWYEFMDFLRWLKSNGAQCVDLLACNLWSNPDWVYVIENLRTKLELTIRASIDITGVDGNFILESDNADMVGIYFTENILQYKHNFYFTSSPHNYGYLNFSPLIFSAENPGYLPATAYTSILGTSKTGTVDASPSNTLTTDISNVLMVLVNSAAVAVLQTNGNVIAFGSTYSGGLIPNNVKPNLYNITKIIATDSWFSALRSDGRVFSWGYYGFSDVSTLKDPSNVEYVAISDMSDQLVNVVDMVSNTRACFALTSSGAVIGWGSIPNGAKTKTLPLSSGVIKLKASQSYYMVAVKNNGVAYYWNGVNFINNSTTNSVNSNPIIDAYINENMTLYIRSAANGTKQVTNLNGSVLYYTIPAGVSIIKHDLSQTTNVPNGSLLLLSNNVLLSFASIWNTCTAITNVTDVVSNQYATAYLQNGTVVAYGNTSYKYGSVLNDATYGVPAGVSLTNVRRLFSTGLAIGALKFDGTFVWWGYGSEPYGNVYYSGTMPTQYPTLYAAISSNIASVYTCAQGFVFNKTDGSIVSFGPKSWQATYSTTNYGTKRAGKNVGYVPNLNGFIAVESTPATSYSISQNMQYVPTTVIYYNNNPDVMAICGRKYSVMVDGVSMGSWYCPADSFTFNMPNIVFTQTGTLTVSICDTPNLTTSYTVIDTFTVTIVPNPSVSPPDPPTITNVASTSSSITVSFTAPAWNGGTDIIAYKYSLDRGLTYTSLSSSSTQLSLTGLTGSSYTIWLVSTSYVGDSYYVETTAAIYNPPSAPTVSSLTLGNQQAVLNVSTSNNGGGAITGYKYAFSPTGTFTSFAVNPSGGVTGATSYTITGLLNNTAYTLYVKSTNGAGDSPSTTYGPFTLSKSVPNSPTITSVVSGDTTMTVNFTAPYNGGDSLTGYRYILNNSVIDLSAVTIGVVSNSFVISGLTNGTSYTVKMSAVNSIGTSSYSTVSSAVVPRALPGAPTITSVTAGDKQIFVEFNAPASNGGSAITGYKYRLNGGVAVDVSFTVDASGIILPFTISGLTNGTAYSLTMTSVNAVGESLSSAASTSVVPSTGPSAPVIQSITAGNQSISVNFTVDNGGSALTSLEYSLNDASNISIATTTSPLVITDLSNGTEYRVKLRVSNANATSDMSEYSAYATPVTIPDAPSIDSIDFGNQYIEITFSPPTYNGSTDITGYKYSLNSGAFIAVGLIQSPYRITNGIQNGTAYSVRLIATNSVGDSSPSTASDSVVPCKAPNPPTIVSVQNGDKTATINLSAGSNGGSAITSYTYIVNDSEPVTISSISSPLVFSDLTIGNVYLFQIKATNSVGDSTFSSTSFTGMSTPDAPVIIGATAGNKSMVVEFFPPNANSSPITSYKYSIADGVYVSATLLDASHISITGLTENTEYTVKIAAVNAIGQSSDSNTSSATPYTYPLSPTIGEITVDNGSASIEFTASSSNSSAITAYSYSLNNGSYITYSSLDSPLVLSDLSNGVAYTIRMKAINAAGSSLSASSASFMPRTVPEAPTITSVTAGNQSCDVGFNPGFFNGATITKYRYSFNGVDFQDATGTTSPITINGLTNGNTYMVYLLAVNSAGESNISAPSSSFVPFVTQSTPEPPIISSVVAGNKSVVVSFTDGINLGSAIKGYMYSVDGGVTRWWAKETYSPLTIIGLENGVEQSIQLCAVNNSGPSEWSVASDLFTPCDVPDAPILTGVQGADSSIVVSFVAGSDNGSAITSYEYSLNNSATYLSLGEDNTIYGLTNGTSYTVKIRAVNSVGASLPSLTSQSVVPYSVPSAPVIDTIVSSDRKITVSFTPGNANGSTISRYEYSLVKDNVESGTYHIASSPGSPIVISGLDNGASYKVLLRAVSSLGAYSDASTISDEVVPAAVPSTPVITKTQAGDQSITVYWVSSPNGSAITNVSYNLNDGPFIDAETTDSSFVITGLTNGSSYTVSIIAENVKGASLPSAVSDAIVPLSAPEPPTVTSVIPGDSKVQIELTPGDANGSSVVGYKYSLDGTTYQWVKDNSSPISIYGLTNGTSYNISLQTVSESVGASNIVELPSPVIPYNSPDAPIIQSISVGNGSAVITFVDGSSNGFAIIGYKYSLDQVNYIDVSAVSGTITLTGLTNGTSYTVSLKSVSAVAESVPSVLSASFMPYTNPSPPAITKITTGNQTASIFITDGSANGSGSRLAYSYTFDGINYYWASSATSPIVISSGLVNNQGYKISVATKTQLGMSAYSAQSTTFVPYTLPNAPTITSVVAGNGVASLYFTDGSNNGRPITKYQYTINGVVYPEVTGTSPLSLTGLTNNVSYTVTLKGANLAGYSPASLASNVFVPFTIPGAPTISSLVPLSGQITVYLSAGSTNGSDIIRYAYSLNGGSYVNTSDAATSFVISGLTNGTSYTVAVKAENAAGFGAASATSSPVIPFTIPNPPTITGVTVGNNSATVAITNGNNNGRTITQYQYTYTSSSGSTTLTTSTSATQLSSILITGLTNWTSYTVVVRAINAAGMSVDSSGSSAFIPYSIPGAPVIASVVPGNASITVNMDGLTIGAGVVGYRYSFDGTTYTYVSGGGSSFTITGLVNATSYQVYVKSVTSKGDSAASVPSSPVVPFTVPNAPTISSVVPENRTVSIYVTDGSNNGRSIINYEYSTDGIKYNIVDPVSPIVLTNLTNWQSYSYYVRTVNIAGSSLPSAQSTEVVPFLVPTSATITDIIPGDGQMTVEMDGYTPDSGIIGYKYSLDEGDFVYVASPAASFVITGLTNGQNYVVSVKSVTTAGDSPASTPFAAVYPRTTPDAPTNVVVTPLNESAVVTFTDGSSNGADILYYVYSLNGDVDTPIKKRPDGTLKIFGISNAVNYTIRLRALNIAGLSPYSSESNTFMPYGIPLVPPVITRILPGNGCVFVHYSAADTNGAPLIKFKYTDGKNVIDLSGTTSPVTIPNLANKKVASISIASSNMVGDSPFTTPILITPGVPLEPVITDVVASSQKLLVYFDVPENNGFNITQYLYGYVGSPALVKATSASTTSPSPLMILGLKNGTPYNVRIVAANVNGNSAVSNSLGNRIPCAPPARVVITTVTPLLDGALVNFVAPVNNGAPLLSYKYALNSSTTYTDVSGLTLPLRIYGIEPNTINTVKVIATNLAGDSIESVPSKPFRFVYLPPSQIKVTALSMTLTTLTVAFLAPAANGAPITGYRYALNDSTTFIDVSGTSLPLVIRDGILPNTPYNVRVVAVNDAGVSVPSLPVSKPVSFVYLPPLAPGITNIVAGNQSAVVTFTGLPARGAPITGYAYTLDASATTIYDVSGAVSPITINGLTNDTLYNVRIAAITPAGYSAWSVAKPVKPVYKAPDKPVIVSVTAGNGQLTVVFTPPAANGATITGYKYRLNGGDILDVTNLVVGKTTSFIITGLTNGTAYSVQMYATNILGDSEVSAAKPGTPKA